MVHSTLQDIARTHLHELCVRIPTRPTGSPGNRQATRYFRSVMDSLGFRTATQPFDCMDMRQGEIHLSAGGQAFHAFISPYSPGCNLKTILAQACTLEELGKADARGSILLLRGDLTREQLMPKNFVFYNPEEHQRIYRLLEEKQPAAIIAATGRNPQLAGALYPFPLIEDGDFDIPSAFMTEVEGEKLADHVGQMIELRVDAERIPSTAENVIAVKNRGEAPRVLVCAHIDAKAGTPGALDNAAGTITLLLLAELLKDEQLGVGVELVAINGEDHYSVGGEMAYLAANQGKFGNIKLAINMDGLGYRGHATGISFYDCPWYLEQKTRVVLARHTGIEEMIPWPQSDHMIFVANQVPALALTTTAFEELEAAIAHTDKDRPELVDIALLAETAEFLRDLLREF
jgi:aminopeptidase YwaD